jgi:hypothetical protein
VSNVANEHFCWPKIARIGDQFRPMRVGQIIENGGVLGPTVWNFLAQRFGIELALVTF